MHILWFLPPWGWLLIVLAGVVGFLHARWVYHHTTPAPTARVRRGLVGLRTAAVALLLLALGQPILLRLLPLDEPPVVAVVVEDSASMALADTGDDTPTTRWSAGWDLAVALGSTAADAGDRVETVVMRGNGLRAPRNTTPAEASASAPDAVGTDLDALLVQTRQQLLGRDVRGLVLVADGNVTTEGDLALSARAAPGDGPTWVVGVGDPVGPADRMLTDLRYPDTVFQGEAATVEVSVADRFPLAATAGAPVTVRLRQDGEVIAEAIRPAGDDVRNVALSFTPQAPGLQVFTLEVSPLDNERFLGNNQTTIVMDVRKDRVRLLLLAARPGWDARFLAQAARREARLALETVYPADHGPVLADSGAAWRAPTTAAGWRRWDGVVLLGPPGSLVTDSGPLAEAVREGLGLFALTAPGDEPDRPGQADLWPAPLVAVLPVRPDPTPVPRRETFLALAAEAARHPVLAEVAALDELPPLRGYRRTAARDDAQVLMVAQERGQTAPGWPALVVGAVGSGRAAWFGGWLLWELAFHEPPRDATNARADETQPMRRLLRNLLLWTALGEQQSGVTLLGQRLVYQEGEPVLIQARWLDLRGDPVTDRPLSVRLEAQDGVGQAVRTFSLPPDLGRPGVGSTVLPPLPAGRYRVTPIGGGDATLAGPTRSLLVTAATVEATQVRQDRQRLRQLAARVGGTYVDAGDPVARDAMREAIAALDLSPAQRTRERRWDLWSSWPYLALVTALLGAEWIIRRRQGML